jgi:porin
VWHHTGGFATFAGGAEDGTTGFYIVLDQQLHAEDAGGDQGLFFFAQYGYADAEVSAVEHHLGAGVQWVGLIPGRDTDVAGLMASYAALSDEAGAGFTDDAETAVELFYKAQITPWLSLKPDIQYISNPGGAGLDDAWVATLRLELVF